MVRVIRRTHFEPFDQLIVQRSVLVQPADGERRTRWLAVVFDAAAPATIVTVVDHSQFAPEQIPYGVHSFDHQTPLGPVHRQSVGRRLLSDVHRSTRSCLRLSVAPFAERRQTAGRRWRTAATRRTDHGTVVCGKTDGTRVNDGVVDATITVTRGHLSIARTSPADQPSLLCVKQTIDQTQEQDVVTETGIAIGRLGMSHTRTVMN